MEEWQREERTEKPTESNDAKTIFYIYIYVFLTDIPIISLNVDRE